MRIKTSLWIEKEDSELVDRVRNYGIRTLARDTGIDAAFISRWIAGTLGITSERHSVIVKHLAEATEENDALNK